MAALTPEDARNYLNRWTVLRQAEAIELRSASMELKAHQLAVLMASRDLFKPDQAREQENIAVRERWARIRRALRG